MQTNETTILKFVMRSENQLASHGVFQILSGAEFSDNRLVTIWQVANLIVQDGSTPTMNAVHADLLSGKLMEQSDIKTAMTEILKAPLVSSAEVKALATQLRRRHLKAITAQRIMDLLESIEDDQISPDDYQGQITALADASVMEINPDSYSRDESEITDDVMKYHDGTLEVETGELMPTGMDCIDQFNFGIRTKSVTVIGGRPGCGKSSFGKSLSLRMAASGYTTAFVSLEMTEMEVSNRMIAEATGIYSQWLTIDNGKSQLDPTEMDQLRRWRDHPAASRIQVAAPVGKRASFEGIKAYMRRAAATLGLKVIVIDYLQLIPKPSRTSEFEFLTEASKQFKQLARELDIAVVLLAQLNRCSDQTEREPRLSDLRGSGAIEQDADNVVFLWRDDQAHKVVIPKWRDGTVCPSSEIPFDGPTVTFDKQPLLVEPGGADPQEPGSSNAYDNPFNNN